MYSCVQCYLNVQPQHWETTCHLGDSFKVGMWQVRWKTLGHLSQQSSSPPFWHTAHQSSLGSSSGSALFSEAGCPADWGLCSFPALVSDSGTGAGAGALSCCRGFDWVPVLLSGRLEPTVDCTCCIKKNSDRLFHVATKCYVLKQFSYKTNFILVLRFILDDNNRPGRQPSPPLGCWGRRSLKSRLPGRRPSVNRLPEEKRRSWPWQNCLI